MSLELLTKAVEDHGTAVKAIGGKIDEAQEGIQQLTARRVQIDDQRPPSPPPRRAATPSRAWCRSLPCVRASSSMPTSAT